MTTLPQTSTIRVPRPAGPAALAVGTPHVAGGGGGAAIQMSGADVVRVLRSNFWLILLSVLVFGTAGYFVNMYLAKTHPRYTADGFVQVTPPKRISSNPNLMGTGLDEEFVNPEVLEAEQLTQAQLLKTETLFGDVLKNSQPVRETAWFKSFEGKGIDAPKEDLRRSLSVTAIPNTRLVKVSMSTAVDIDAQRIVRELVDAFLAQQRDRAVEQTRSRMQYYEDVQTKYRTAAENISSQMQNLARNLSLQGGAVAGRLSSKEVELQNKVTEALKAQMDIDGFKETLDSLDRDLSEGRTPRQVEMEIQRDPELLYDKQQLVSAELQVKMLAARGFAPGHRAMLAAVAVRDEMQKQWENRRAEVEVTQGRILRETLMSAVEGGKQKLAVWNKEIEAVQKELGDLSYDMGLYLTYSNEEKAYRELRDQANQQVDAILAAQKQNLSQVDWVSLPQRPERMSFPKLPVVMAVAIFLGLSLSLGIAFLREIMDTRIRTPRDIARVGPMTLLGIICDESEDPQAAGARLPLVIAEAPHSALAEQLRQMRTRLQHAASLDTTRSLLVTSPGPGDGKTTIAINLAAGLALNGRRILLVDANFRRPEVHKIFGVSNERGLGDVLSSLDGFDAAVQQTHVPNLALLTSGPKPANPTELFESQLMVDFLERALEEYDHVIFDGGPVLLASEAAALAPRVDGVITVVRARANSRGVLQRVRETLRQTKAEHLGVVLNAVRAQGGGYYSRNIKTYYSYQSNGN